MAELVLDGVTKAYGRHTAVRAVELAVGDGELLALLGPSGSGKTTLLRLIAGLEDCDAGRVLIGGRDVTRDEPARRDVGMVFQSHALFPHLTVRRNISYGLEARRADGIAEKVDDAAERLGIAALLERRPGRLSGGERQRVALARALVRRPAVLLLDEPLSSLDAPLRAELRREIARLRGELGLTMVYVTHDQAEALALGDRVAVLRDGALDQVGTPDEVYARPRTIAVARFVGVAQINLLPESNGVVVGVRPEDVRLGAGEPGHVELVEHAGDHALVTVALDTGGSLTARVASEAAHAPGDRVTAGYDPARAHRFDAASGERRP